MAYYNNPFPATYQQYYPQTYQAAPVVNQQNHQQQTNSSIVWVQGEAGAKSYLVAPNTTVQLWDSEDQIIYLKSADASGMPSIKILDYTIRDAQSDSKATKDESHKFISKKEFDGLQEQIESLRADVDKIKRAKPKRIVETVEVEDDE